MKKSFILCILFICNFLSANCQMFTLSGKVYDKKRQTPVEYAVISVSELSLAAISSEDGSFILKKVPLGTFDISVSILGYQKQSIRINVDGNKDGLVFYLQEDNLKLNEVVVTASKKAQDLTTAYTIERAALDQLQVLNVSEIATLLPGGQTNRKVNLATTRGGADRIVLRSNDATELGLQSFGTVVEVDGVRISGNSQFVKDIKGADTRNVASNNIESVEIITGVPSVEHGDLSNGMIRINSKKGKSPLNVELSTKPNTKTASFDKGFDLGKSRGVLNASFEHAKSNSDIASPYTTYERNNLSLIYSNTFSAKRNPILFSFGLTGNIGGYNSQGDPDAFVDTYSKERDNVVRSNLKLDWLLNKPWITRLEFSGTLSYSDLMTETKTNKSGSSSTPAIHALEEGYYIGSLYDVNPNAEVILIPAGYWYQTSRDDSRPLVYSAKLKANWTRKHGKAINRLMIGSDFNRTTNFGRGEYYTDMRYAPSWREYRYDEQPAINNLALFAEDEVNISLPEKRYLRISVGLRSDLTHISNSKYGTVSSLSPRISAKYLFWNRTESTVSQMSMRVGFGDAVKLPSSYILNPTPTYQDKRIFSPEPSDGNTTFYAFYTIPGTTVYNPSLKWQRSRLTEVELNARISRISVSLTAYYNKTIDPFSAASVYTPYSYRYTDQTALDNSSIPRANRVYSIDRVTGIVTVSDITGNFADEQLAYTEKRTFKSNSYYYNGNSYFKQGLEWVVNFGKIPSISTSVQVDGSYNYYKGVETSLVANLPSISQDMADRNPYKYIGLYEGSAGSSNGSLSKKVRNNISITSHIPSIRTIISLRVESTLYSYRRMLSESAYDTRSYVLDSKSDYLPSASSADIYKGDKFVAVYPLYYVSIDDMDTRIPFKDALIRAKENDQALFNELTKMIVKTNTTYYFKPNVISAYFSANLNVTKELGDHISISFLANNFLNNMAKVKNRQNGNQSTLYNSSYIPDFYYGMTLRVKI